MPMDRVTDWARLLDLGPEDAREFFLAAALTHIERSARDDILRALPASQAIEAHPVVVALRQEIEQLRERLAAWSLADENAKLRDIIRRGGGSDREAPVSRESLDRRLLDESERGGDAARHVEAPDEAQTPHRRPRVS